MTPTFRRAARSSAKTCGRWRPHLRRQVGPGAGNAAARRVLSSEELAALTELRDGRSLLAVASTAAIIVLAVAFGVVVWPSPWLALSVLVIGVQQHAMFILAHESSGHYRCSGHGR